MNIYSIVVVAVDSSSLVVSESSDSWDEETDDFEETDELEVELDLTVMCVCVGEYWGLY